MDILKVQQANNDLLLKKEGVYGTAIGEKWHEGQPTGSPAILVFVQKKYKESSITNPKILKSYNADDLIPEHIDGIPTDVFEVGTITKQTGYKSKVRPIKPGYSCGHKDITAGTIGGIFLDKNKKPVILSNNHVIANENKAKIGDIIYQPGPADFIKNRSNIIAKLSQFVKLKRNNNTQDSAIALINDNLINNIDDIYPQINMRIKDFGEAKVGQLVQKCGRTTGYTTGRVLGLNASFNIGYDFGNASFNQCVVTTAMSKAGDSGSIIQDMDNKAVALLFAGSPKVTIANPIDLIVQQYGLTIFSQEYSAARKADTIDNSWIIKTDPKSDISIVNDQISIDAYYNSYCFIEHPISDFNQIKCSVFTGNDESTSWSPGLSVHWSNGFIKINLRHNGSFGGYSHLNKEFSIGISKPNRWYKLRIIKQRNVYLGQIRDNKQWNTIVAVPIQTLNGDPTVVRLGKTNPKGLPISHRNIGSKGLSKIKEFKIT